MKKQISTAEHNYWKYAEAIADRPADAFLRSKGMPVKGDYTAHHKLYTTVHKILNNKIIAVSRKDINILNKFIRTWQTNSGNLTEPYVHKIQSKCTHYGNLIRNKKLRTLRLEQKKSV